MFVNADIPHFYCFLRKEYLYDLKEHYGEFVPVAVFGIKSIQARAITFHCMSENGACFDHIPINALAWKKGSEKMQLDNLELWDCFSYDVSVTKFQFLKNLRVRTFLKDGKIYWGEYMFTIDWAGTEYAEDYGEGGHKSAHIIKLDNGNFAGQPNNRIFWHEPSFITKPFMEKPDYKTNSYNFKAEGIAKWKTTADDLFYYEVEKTND